MSREKVVIVKRLLLFGDGRDEETKETTTKQSIINSLCCPCVSVLSKELISREAHLTFQFSPFTFQIKRLRLLGLFSGEYGDYGYCGEPGYKPQLLSLPSLPRK